jgi:hypothetical protein
MTKSEHNPNDEARILAVIRYLLYRNWALTLQAKQRFNAAKAFIIDSSFVIRHLSLGYGLS